MKGREKTLFFRRDGITVSLRKGPHTHAIAFDFVGANPDVEPVGRKQQTAVFSYFLGQDPEKWTRGAPSYGELLYRDLWPGIDLACQAGVGRLKFTYVVHPGADPGRIRLKVRGAERVHLDDGGALHAVTPVGELVDERPVAWQEQSCGRADVAVDHVLETGGKEPMVRFEVGDRDPMRPLFLDPAFLVYCGYIGGEHGEVISGVAVDAGGYLYVAGGTKSDETTFPVKVGPGLKYQGNGDVFVAKAKPDGTGLVYCGYIGSNNSRTWETANGIAVDARGNVYLTGQAGTGYPLKVGPKLNNATFGAFVTKLNASGTDLVYSGYISGEKGSTSRGIAVDAMGNAYIAGETLSDEKTFPVKVGPDLTFNGEYDTFVAKVNAQGTDLVYCGYLGGSWNERINAVAVDRQGRMYVAGYTMSDQKTFPVKVGPRLVYQGATIPLFASDAFVARVNADGKGLEYCGYIGGNEPDEAFGVAVDAQGRAYVTGFTSSTDTSFPVKTGPDLTRQGGADAFICRVEASGKDFEYCGFIGGAGWEYGWAVAVDARGAAFITGETSSPEQTFPVKHGPGLRFTYLDDAFVAKVAPDGKDLVYCGYIGGSDREEAHGIAVDPSGNAYVGGWTISDEKSFPVTVGPDLTFNETNVLPSADAFVAKIALVLLSASGSTRAGGRMDFTLDATDDAGRYYQAASSFSAGPIPIDTRTVGLGYDGLLWLSLSGLLPDTFLDYRGTIGPDGRATASLVIPDLGEVIGLKIHTAFVTLDPAAPSGIKSISNTVDFTISKG